MNSTSIFFDKNRKVLLKPGKEKNQFIPAIRAELNTIGYDITPALATVMGSLPPASLSEAYRDLVIAARKSKGMHRKFVPLEELPNPSASSVAAVHSAPYDLVDIGSEEEFLGIFTQLMSSPVTLSESDKQIITWFVGAYHGLVVPHIPENVPNKESVALLLSALAVKTEGLNEALVKLLKTPADALRFVTTYKNSETPSHKVKLHSLPRSTRRTILAKLETFKDTAEAMKSDREQWKRVGEILHPREMQGKFPKTAEAFSKIRSGEKITTWDSRLETALSTKDGQSAIKLLTQKPGIFARKLDQILSFTPAETAVAAFEPVASKVATPLLVALWEHFSNRHVEVERVMRTRKGKTKLLPPKKALSANTIKVVTDALERAVSKKFAALPKLGKVYLAPGLENLTVPVKQRHAGKALKTLQPGSVIELGHDQNVIRFFIWWKEAKGDRTDIDLSCSVLDDNFNWRSDVSFYSLNTDYGRHSGDITSAPDGACEFVEINLEKVEHRYLLMAIFSWTGQPFNTLPECFAGWQMAGKIGTQGVRLSDADQKFDISSDQVGSMPLIIDTVERKIIWMDAPLKTRACGHAANDRGMIHRTCQSVVKHKKMSIKQLMDMHISARGGEVTDTVQDAELIIGGDRTSTDQGVKTISPYDPNAVAVEFLS